MNKIKAYPSFGVGVKSTKPIFIDKKDIKKSLGKYDDHYNNTQLEVIELKKYIDFLGSETDTAIIITKLEK